VEKVAEDRPKSDNFLTSPIGVPVGILIVLVAALVVALVAAVVFLQGKESAEDDLEKAEKASQVGPDAQEAAERILGEMISYDYKDIDDEYSWTKYLGNDELRDTYETKILPRLAKLIKGTKASAEGEIVESAYNLEDDGKVTVLAFVRQELTDAQHKKGALADQWASLTMVRDGDDWLIDDVDIVSVPPPS
jgi:hypothetical protein